MRMLAEDELREAVLLIFANKQDLPNAMNAAEITDKLGLHSLRNRNWYIQVIRGRARINRSVSMPDRFFFPNFTSGYLCDKRRRVVRGLGLALQPAQERQPLREDHPIIPRNLSTFAPPPSNSPDPSDVLSPSLNSATSTATPAVFVRGGKI